MESNQFTSNFNPAGSGLGISQTQQNEQKELQQ